MYSLALRLLLGFHLLVPPLLTQRKIAAVLSAYDDLIENNTRRIAILEEFQRLIDAYHYDRLPECYSEELCEQKRDDIYQHVYANYWGAGQSVYAAA
jgi:hypothetical protein